MKNRWYIRFKRPGERNLIYISYSLWKFFGLISLRELRFERIAMSFNRRLPFGFMLYSYNKEWIGNLSIQFWIDI